jgi:hypothetical protein
LSVGALPRSSLGQALRAKLSPVRSPAGRLPQKHWLATTCNTVAPQGAFTAFVGARLRAKRFRQFVRRQAGSHRSTGSQRRATQLLHRERSPLSWERACARSAFASSFAGRPAPTEALARNDVQHSCSTGSVHRSRGSAPAREALSPVRSPAGRLPQKHWLATTCNTVAYKCSSSARWVVVALAQPCATRHTGVVAYAH